MCILFERCSEVLMYFSFLYTLASCIPVLWPFIYYIHCTLFFIYRMMYVLLHLSLHLLFLFFLYTNISLCMHSLFLFHTWGLDEFLFKCFRKTGCESLPCHELSSCKVFQEFMLGLDLFCGSTSGYELSDIRLLSWLFVLLWFYHGLPNGEIVRDIFM